jgi:antitoxin StbD
MTTRILAELATSITELKANPMKAVASGHGMPIAVLNRNEPAFYCVPADAYEQLMDKLEDLELLSLAKERENEPAVKVSLNDL